MNEGQVESTTDGQAEAPESQVEETPIVEQVGQLLRQDNQTEEPKETPEVNPEERQEEPQQEAGIIDDAMIQQFPNLKMWRGKSIKDELPKALYNITKKFTETSMELGKLKDEKAKQSLPKPSDVPDPVEKPEEFKQWLADYTEGIRKQSQPQPQPRDIVSDVAKALPQDTDVNKVVDEWSKFYSERLFNEFGNLRPEIQSFYDKNPHILVNEIKSFYELSSKAQKNAMTIQTEAKNQAYKTVTNSIKKSNENKENLSQAQFNQVPRSDQMTAEDRMLANIFEIAKGNNSL